MQYCKCNLVYLIHSIYVPFCVGVVLKFEEIRVIGVKFHQGKRNLIRVSGGVQVIGVLPYDST